MDRRQFIKTVSIGSIGARWMDPADLFALSGEKAPALAAVTGSDYGLAVSEAIKILGGISRFVSRGDVVLVKPNMSFDRTPDQAANTHPAVVARVVELAYEAGAKTVKVFDNTVNDSRRSYERSGVAEAARAAGAIVEFTENRNFKRVEMNGDALGKWWVHRDVLEADKLINVPVAKHHTMCRLTLSMKNLMGLVGGPRYLLHQKLNIKLADMTAYFKPVLNVLDGTRILTANGPYGGNLNDVKVLNTVAASVDPVAVDSYGATWFGMTGDDLGFVRVAYERGLGEKDVDRLNVVEKQLS
jgi:uncharacterized protein (DUF362 family)